MSKKSDLRTQRDGTIINHRSKKDEGKLGSSLEMLRARLEAEFKLELTHEKEWKLKDVVSRLRHLFPDVEFSYKFETSAMRPDGGILSIQSKTGTLFPILITEVKNQGTNDLRATEGKPKQAKGNAIERLGKNVIGFRTALLGEQIVPFVCFGYGCDFDDTSSILDRVTTIAMFGPLNKISVVSEGEGGIFNRGSFFFREDKWTEDEMAEIMYEVAKRSIHYYFAKYGDKYFNFI
jgi:type II restriction enzyme